MEGKLEKVYTMLDRYTSKYFTLLDECKVMSKGFSKCLGMNLISDSNGNLVFLQPDGRMMEERQYKSVDEEITNINNFAEWLQHNGIEYIYVNVPSPVDPENESDIIEEGYEEYTNQMADELLEGLDKAGINYLDIRQLMKTQGISYTDSFFQYDHHWLPQTGLWAAGEISKCINEYENLTTDDNFFDIGNYDVKTSVEKHLGSFGNIVTSAYADKTPIDLLYPKFHTNIRKIIYNYGIDITDEFKEVMYCMWKYPSYSTYNHGRQPLKKYVNTDESAANINILLLTDSYSLVVSPFLACSYTNIDEIELRKFDGSLEMFVKENNYDLVISISSAFCLNYNDDLFIFK